MPAELSGRSGEPPGPAGARSVDELSSRLRALQAWAGLPYREVHRQVVRSRRRRGVVELPSFNTVYRCLQPGRSRLDCELVADIARVLLGDEQRAVEWLQAYQIVTGRAIDASLVTVADVLPAVPADFGGRDAELGVLSATVRDGVGVVAVDGMAGVGKTALVHAFAHRLPRADVCLAVNLRGYDPDRPPADPAAVLDGFLRRLGVPGAQIHGLDLPGRVTRFRQLLTGRQALIVLDNAASEDQVRPLLPGTDGCVVLVTSRQRLELPGSRELQLTVLSADESAELLRRIAGPALIDPCTPETARIVELAGRLPLALSLVGRRIRASSGWSLADHVERLDDQRRNLRLDAGVELALVTSYDAVPPEHRRTVRLLGLVPGRSFDAYPVAALTGSSVDAVRTVLAELAAASLVEEPMPGRYELHDLVRIFAAARAHDEDAPAARRTALTRLFDHYRAAAAAAMDSYAPHEAHRRPDLGAPASELPAFAERDDARSWLDTERANLLALASYCGRHGSPDHTAHLSIILFRYLDVAGHYQDSLALHGLASEVADRPLRGRALYYLSIARITLGQYGPAAEGLEEAEVIFRENDDRTSEAATLTTMAGLHWRTGRFADSIEAYDRAMVTIQETGDQSAAGHALSNLGLVNCLLGRYPRALEVLREALEIVRRSGDQVAAAHTLTAIGGVYERLGELDRAETAITESLDTVRAAGYRLGEADALSHLGAVRFAQRRLDEALECFRQALDLVRADGVRELEVQTLNRSGPALRAAGRIGTAARYHRRALRLATAIDDRYERARAHDGLGWSLVEAGKHAAGMEHWRRALEVFDELGTPEAGEVRAVLDEHALGAAGDLRH